MVQAFAVAIIKQADNIVLAILLLAFCAVADRLFRSTFRTIWHGFMAEVAQVAQLKFNARAVNLIGGVFGVVFFVLLIAGDSIIVHVFKIQTDIPILPLTISAAGGTWLYFLASIWVCKGSR